MKKRLISLLLSLSMLLCLFSGLGTSALAATSTVSSRTDTRINYMLTNIDYQSFSGSTIQGGKVNAAQVKEYIKHFMFDSSFAAIGGGAFNYPNSGAYTWQVTDGTYTRDIRGSTGCCAYCYFVTKVIYGVDWFDSKQQTSLHSASELKSFLLRYGQAGEHLRADPSHSVTFISGDDEGFYCFSYCGDSNPVIHLDYWTYEAFYARYGGYNVYVYDVFKADNSSTQSCRNGHHYNASVAVAPTDAASGTLRCYCPVCQNTKDVTLPKLNKSDYRVETVGQTTCTAGAVERYTWKNTEYGTFFFDKQLAASGSHDYRYSLSAAPTEAAEGSLKSVCAKCGSEEYIKLPQLNGFDYEQSIEGIATCTEGCKIVYTYKDKSHGTYRFDVTIPPMGHAYFDTTQNTVTKTPTAEKDGELVCSCLHCGNKLRITLPAFSEDEYSYEVTKAPTVKETGIGTYTWLVQEYGDYSFEIELDKLPKTTNPFTDVDKDAVYCDAILWAYYHEPEQITGGYGNNDFRPKADCTRAQVVTFLWRAAGCPEPTGSADVFKDADSIASPYRKAVAWAVERGITNGFNDGGFHPNDTVTRAQFVTFLWRYEGAEKQQYTVLEKFTDYGDIASPYKDAVAWAVNAGVTTGYGDGSFRPNDTCTRWAVVLFMYRDLA